MRAGGIFSTSVAVILAGGLLAGCGGQRQALHHSRDFGRPDAAWPAELRDRSIRPPEWAGKTPETDPTAGTQSPADYRIAGESVLRVIGIMRSRFGCQVSLTPEAAEYIHETNPRVKSEVPDVPENLGFEVLRAIIEAGGLVVTEAPNASMLGTPHFLIDRSLAREATAAASPAAVR
jgi:hypothetical protein